MRSRARSYAAGAARGSARSAFTPDGRALYRVEAAFPAPRQGLSTISTDFSPPCKEEIVPQMCSGPASPAPNMTPPCAEIQAPRELAARCEKFLSTAFNPQTSSPQHRAEYGGGASQRARDLPAQARSEG